MSDIQHVRIKDIGAAQLGSVIEVRGWLRNKPGGKGRYFLWLRDGSGEIQAVAEQGNLDAATWANCECIGIESSLIAQGEVRAHPKHDGVYELELKQLIVVQAVSDYPIGKKSHGVDFLMKNRHLWIRGKRQAAILRIRSALHKAISDFFHTRGFYRVDTPIFTPNACEGTTTLFEVDYHGDTVYLAQSGQLYNEADIGALGQVYCFGPTFRAEKSKTRRHLLEFWMLEMEAAYCDHFDNMRFQEELMAYMVKHVLKHNLADLRIIWDSIQGKDKLSWDEWIARLEPATETPYPRIRYGELIEQICAFRRTRFIELSAPLIVKAQIIEGVHSIDEATKAYDEDRVPFKYLVKVPVLEETVNVSKFHWGDDFGAADEIFIGGMYKDDPEKRYKPVFVTNFPVEIKGFYFKDELNADGSLRVDKDFLQLQHDRPDLIPKDANGNPKSTGHTVAGSDLIGSKGAGELIGASQREDDIARLKDKLKRHNLPREYLEWYVDLRRYGSVPHSGFGLGFERTVAWICGSAVDIHLRETTAFPRMLHQFEP